MPRRQKAVSIEEEILILLRNPKPRFDKGDGWVRVLDIAIEINRSVEVTMDRCDRLLGAGKIKEKEHELKLYYKHKANDPKRK